MMSRLKFSTVALMFAMIMLDLPVAGNPLTVTLTNYTIYKDNQPVDEPINLTVNCYGTFNEYRLMTMGRATSPNPSESELIYSLSLSCEPGNCLRQGSNNPTWGTMNTSCDMYGEYHGTSFFEKNFTTNLEPSCAVTKALSLGGYGKYKHFTEYYAISDQDRTYCDTQYDNAITDLCDPFLEPDRPSAKEEQIYRVSRNKTTFIASEKFIDCIGPVQNAQRECYEKHSLINVSELKEVRPALYCEKRFDLPSESISHQTVIIPKQSGSYLPSSPIIAIYCRVVELLGGRCE